MHDTHTAVPQLQLHILFHIALLLAYKVAYCITFRPESAHQFMSYTCAHQASLFIMYILLYNCQKQT